MTREYPGNPARLDAIRSEIHTATGAINPVHRCFCGKPAMIISPSLGIIRVACPCGLQGSNASSTIEAVKNWNRETMLRILELAR